MATVVATVEVAPMAAAAVEMATGVSQAEAVAMVMAAVEAEDGEGAEASVMDWVAEVAGKGHHMRCER